MKPLNLFFILFFSFSLYASEKTSILIVHSYSQEYPWTKKQHDSFVKVLKNSNRNFDFFTEYLDTKRLKLTKNYQKDFVAYLKMKYADAKIDLVYVSDDNALNFINSSYDKLFNHEASIPVFFSGINNLNISEVLSHDKFTGIYEIKEVEPNIELIKQFSPQTRDIYFIGDNSNTYKSIKKIVESSKKKFSNLNFNYIADEYIINIKKNLPNKPRSFVVLTTIGNLKDKNNNTLLPSESIRIIKENKNIILLTMEDGYMYEGVVGGYVTSGSIQGSEAASLVLKYLEDGNLQNINSLKSSSAYYFNSNDIKDSRIVLSEYIARNATILGEDLKSIVDRKSLLLDMFTVFSFLLMVFIFFIYAIKTKKYNVQLEKLKELENVKSRLNEKDEFINNILSFNSIGYWKLDIRNDKLFISLELLNMLEIDSDMYDDDPDVISYFIHSNDKKVYNENLNYVKESKKSVVFHHRFISSSKNILNATHMIYTQHTKYSPDLIIGIVKIEK